MDIFDRIEYNINRTMQVGRIELLDAFYLFFFLTGQNFELLKINKKMSS